MSGSHSLLIVQAKYIYVIKLSSGQMYLMLYYNPPPKIIHKPIPGVGHLNKNRTGNYNKEEQ